MRAEDPWLVMRYTPLLIDDHVYFAVAVPSPAGKWRKDEIGVGVTYVDPITGTEFSRERQDLLGRASFASVSQVQEVLELLHPKRYRALKVSCSVPGSVPLTLVTRASKSGGLGKVGWFAKTSLEAGDNELIEKFSRREGASEGTGTISVVARLIEARGPTQFLRLAVVLAETIWSV